MEKVFRIFEMAINTVMVLLGITSIIGGLMTGMWHCYLIGAMCLAVPYVWWKEEKR